MTGLFGPQGANAVTTKPNGFSNTRYTGQTWVKDSSAPGMNDGTVLDAAFFNRIISNLDYIVGISGVSTPLGDETALYKGIMGAVAGGAPDMLNTLKELADALGDNPNFAAQVTASLGNRLRFDSFQTLTTAQKSTLKSNIGLTSVAYSGSYTDLSGLPTLGSAAALNVGTAANNVVQLDGSAKMPAVDGSALTSVTVTWGNVSSKPSFATVATSGVYADLSGKPALGSAAALNVGTAANNVVQLDGSAKMPAVDGSALANVTVTWGNVSSKPSFATVATSGVYADLSGKPALGSAAALNVGTAANNVVQLDGSGKMPAVDGSALINVAAATAAPQGDFAGMYNGTLVQSAVSGVLTISVKTFAGVDPSVGDPTYFYFRNSALGNGTFTRVAVTSALSVVLPSGATLGAVSGAALRVWLQAFNDGGTVRLAAINCSNQYGVICPDEAALYTTLVPGNSAQKSYSTVAITAAAAWRFIGYVEWTALTTAGTWTAPSVMQLFGPGVKKPGEVVQEFTLPGVGSSTSSTSAVALGSPVSIKPSSGVNLIDVNVRGSTTMNSPGNDSQGTLSIARGGGATYVGQGHLVGVYGGNNGWYFQVASELSAFEKANTTATLTYQVYGYVSGTTSGATMTYPAGAGSSPVAQLWKLREIMG